MNTHMTIRQLFEKRLYECGMFDKDIAAVMESVIAAKENEAVQGRWDENPSGYPPQLLAALWFSVRKHTLAWIDANCPQAFYRAMFVNEPQADEPTYTEKGTT